jgi:O-antigen ligase
VTWVLAAILWFGLLTLRTPGRWALTGFELALFTLAGVIIVQRRGALRIDPVALLLAASAAWPLLQIAAGTSVDTHRTLESALQWTTYCTAFSIGLVLTEDRARRRQFLTAQLIFALLLSIGAVVGLFSVSALGPFVYRNQFAAYVESLIGVAIAAAIRDRRSALAWLLVSAALFASVIAAGSRAGSILCLAELILLPLVAFTRGWISSRSLARVALLSAAAAAALVAVVGWETIWRRFEEPNPYSLRAELTRSTVNMIRDRPLFGFGLGTWSAAYPAYARFDDGTFVNQAHNDWAQWAAEGGLPFFVMMLAMAGLLVRPAIRSLWGLGLMAVFVHAFVDYPFQQRPALAAFFFALAGVLRNTACNERAATSSPGARSPAAPYPASAPSESSPPVD